MKSLFPDICSTKIPESKAFYINLFNFDVVFELDWHIQLKSPKDENLQLAFVRLDHPSVPLAYQRLPQGVVITIETDGVDHFYKLRKVGRDYEDPVMCINEDPDENENIIVHGLHRCSRTIS